ncbi:hypothetical protein [Kribbella kalugense]|uniref:Uncharacterized protein n=1 Tax=Kribbella kalugense TaxID=2512221 RepID=A0A4R7ZZM1_9ACTN|nr:hypothetical protein [Kribbella kalugense]TDW21240.1 hypothetical protein EV650_0056 [Kribbella kalugense]
MQTKSADPLLLGFVLKHLLTAEDELAEAEACMKRFAEGNGYSLGAVYLEESVRTLTAFTGLIQAVNEHQGSATVLVPSLLHFQALDPSTDVKDAFERTTGARVVVTRPSP